MAEVIGELVIEVRPHCHVDVLLEMQKKVIKELHTPVAHTKLKAFV